MSPFTFEQQVDLSEQDYVRLFGLVPLHRKRSRLGLLIAGALLCLLWPYTVALGVFVLALVIVAQFAPRLLPAGARYTYRDSPHLHRPLTCGVSDKDMWVHGQSFRSVSEWENLRVWRESSGWLILSPNGCVPVFLSLEKLKHFGVYERVLDLARQNGAEFGKRRSISA